MLSAQLHAFRDFSLVRNEYPLFLPPISVESDERSAKPLAQCLDDALATFAPEADSARMLRDNLPWIEHHVRRAFSGGGSPVEAAPLLVEAGLALQDQIGLDEDNRERLQQDLDRLAAACARGWFLGYSRHAALHLFVHAVRGRTEERRRRYRQEVDQAIAGLRRLLAVERQKSGSAGLPSTGGGESSQSPYLESDALSAMLEHRSRGSIKLSPDRQARIEGALRKLEAHEDESIVVRFVESLDAQWREEANFEVVGASDPCAAAAELFEREAARMGEVFSAVRIARLEVKDLYSPAVHDSWFASFDWTAFSPDEIQLITPVVALESAERIATEGLPTLSKLLNSGKPVQVFAWVEAHKNPGSGPVANPAQAYRLELGYFGIGHRQVVVSQASAARHEHLLHGFIAALDSNRTGLHLIDTGHAAADEAPAMDPWLVASAALESRAHPYIVVNPSGGDGGTRQVSFDGNPQPEKDWPIDPVIGCERDGNGVPEELAFTFAHYCLAFPRLAEHFRLVPATCQSDDLIPLADYLDGLGEDVDREVPYIWAIDAEGAPHRLVVSRQMVLMCRDRQSYWRDLQELSGIRNLYVDLAIARVREDAQLEAAAERDRLEAEHGAEIERVRNETADQLMGQLARTLLSLDPTTLASGAPAAVVDAGATPEPESATAEPATVEGEPDVEEAAQDEELDFSEPYIDSILCTTCDDCMLINKEVFVYNDNKQAIIQNAKAATYAQLVEAAEICPARCIHPGKPLNPDEPNLDELIARAEPYN
jgi:ferredoxin